MSNEVLSPDANQRMSLPNLFKKSICTHVMVLGESLAGNSFYTQSNFCVAYSTKNKKSKWPRRAVAHRRQRCTSLSAHYTDWLAWLRGNFERDSWTTSKLLRNTYIRTELGRQWVSYEILGLCMHQASRDEPARARRCEQALISRDSNTYRGILHAHLCDRASGNDLPANSIWNVYICTYIINAFRRIAITTQHVVRPADELPHCAPS